MQVLTSDLSVKVKVSIKEESIETDAVVIRGLRAKLRIGKHESDKFIPIEIGEVNGILRG